VADWNHASTFQHTICIQRQVYQIKPQETLKSYDYTSESSVIYDNCKQLTSLTLP